MALIRIDLLILAGLGGLAMAATSATESPLQGTWTLVAADKILPSGEQVRDYGADPKGRLVVDAKGRYSLQIYKSERPLFSSSDKANGSADEFKAAVMGSSTHFGTITIDARDGTLVFAIESASFPNWEGSVQKRRYTLKDGILTYKVPPRPDGSIPISVWQRQD